MSLTSLAVKIAAPLPNIEGFERYLFIGPHPDDIEIGAGATAAKLAAAGKSVCFLICTDGRYGDGGTLLRGDALVEARKVESRAGAETLGVKDVRFLPLSDGGFYAAEELETAMAQVIGDFQPDVIFAPDPNVGTECHPDHLNAGRTAQKLAYFCRYGGIMSRYGAKSCEVKALAQYFTARPNRCVAVRGFEKKQREAIFTCHKSQFPQGAEAGEGKAIALYLTIRNADMALRSLKGSAEGFRVSGVTQMHCLPEADI